MQIQIHKAKKKTKKKTETDIWKKAIVSVVDNYFWSTIALVVSICVPPHDISL